MMKVVTTSIGEDRYTTAIKAGEHLLTADEPEELGGKDSGPTASELLLASLGACTAITLRMYADRKEWPLKKVDVRLNLERKTESGILTTDIKRELHFEGELTEEQRERLMIIADKCPIHKTLTSEIRITTMMKN